MIGEEKPRPGEPRIEPLAEPSDEAAELLALAMRNGNGSSPNILTTIAHHTRLLKHFSRLGGFLLNRGSIPVREREIVILRVGANAQSVYEFGQHTIIGRRSGLSDAEIAALAADDPGDGWADHERDLIAMADELCGDDCVSDATFGRLRARWDEAELVELVVCAGFYRLVSGFLNTMGVSLDDGVPGWPDREL
jgi:alkylhydroperoxidase family enzyme